ncbi:MAG: aminopeptidase [Spirochaetaceae bacterium]|jgi:predicted aminopeptidase|nr:aminopeptidase [Spirochaetaceae bacterium]
MKMQLSVLCAAAPVLAAAAVLLVGAAFFSGCYTVSQGAALLGYLHKAVPLESLAEAAGDGEESLADFAARVQDIRRFAMEELGLRASKNYTRYVEMDRDYLAAVVSASAKDSFARHEWWFPVVGKVPYKGFFDIRDARKEREALEKQDLDVWVRGVDAFSTLGWFQDPLYSYMRNYPVYRLANLLIHELLHATVFLKGHVQFNEELAEFVGTEGARLYIARTYGEDSEEYRMIEGSGKDGAVFLAFIRNLIAELETLYTSEADREEKLRRKAEIIRNAQARFEAGYDALFQTGSYRGFAQLAVNNAYLEIYRLYYEEDSFFMDLYERSGKDLPRFIAAARSLKTTGSRGRDPKTRLAEALNQPPQ